MSNLIQRALAFLQMIAQADKTAIVAAAVGAVTLLAARFGFQLNASVTAYVAVLISGLVTAFTHVHFARKAAARRAALGQLRRETLELHKPVEVVQHFHAGVPVKDAPQA